MMFPFKAALRFILSKNNKTFINILSYISILTLSLGTAAMIIVLSVYNGLENTLKSIYEDFDADIKIENIESKYFNNDLISDITALENVESVSGILENKVILQQDQKEVVAYLKGVDSNFIEQNRIVNNLTEGDFVFEKNKLEHAVFGRGVKYSLGINSNSNFQNIKVFALNEGKELKPNTIQKNLFNDENIKVSGVFAIENSFDNNYVFSSLSFAQKLFNNTNKVSSYEVKLKNINEIKETKLAIKNKIGEEYIVLTSIEQRAGLYKILQTEKLVVYIVFGIVLLLSSINIFFLLTMMGVEKQKDIAIMFSFGAKRFQIRNVFISQGIIIGFSSVVLGSFIGFILTTLQKKFGFISIQMSSSILEAYPIDFNFTDMIIISIMVLIISATASIFPGLMSSSKNKIFNLNKLIS